MAGPVTLDLRASASCFRLIRLLKGFDQLRSDGCLLLIDAEDPRALLFELQMQRVDRFDWNVLEDGPALWRVEIVRRDPLFGSVGRQFQRDYERLMRLLERARCDNDELAMRELRVGLRRHIHAEEWILYPLYLQAGGNAPEIERLREEHFVLESLLDHLPDPGAAEELAGLIAPHKAGESNLVLPSCEVLPHSTRCLLIRRAQAL